MAALTASTTFNLIKKVYSDKSNFVICNAKRIYGNAFVGIPGANALTSCRGYCVPWQDQVNIQWLGLMEPQGWTGGLITSAQSNVAANVGSVLGDTTAGIGINGHEVSVECGPMIFEGTVTGISAITDVWKTKVYCNTDNFADMSTTASAYAPSIGICQYWFSSTRCQVYLWGRIIRYATTI